MRPGAGTAGPSSLGSHSRPSRSASERAASEAAGPARRKDSSVDSDSSPVSVARSTYPERPRTCNRCLPAVDIVASLILHPVGSIGCLLPDQSLVRFRVPCQPHSPAPSIYGIMAVPLRNRLIRLVHQSSEMGHREGPEGAHEHLSTGECPRTAGGEPDPLRGGERPPREGWAPTDRASVGRALWRDAIGGPPCAVAAAGRRDGRTLPAGAATDRVDE